MKKLLVLGIAISSFFLLTAGKCSFSDACATETMLHNGYVVAAPLLGRSATAQAREQKIYDLVMSLCGSGAPPSKIEAAQAQSAAARSQP